MTRRGGYDNKTKTRYELTPAQMRAAIAKKTRDLQDLRAAYAAIRQG